MTDSGLRMRTAFLCFAFMDPGCPAILGCCPMFSEGISQKRSDIRGPILLLVGKLGLACIYVRAQEELGVSSLPAAVRSNYLGFLKTIVNAFGGDSNQPTTCKFPYFFWQQNPGKASP